MARVLVTCALVALFAVAALARAQDAGVVAPRVRVVRPPEGSLRRGPIVAPAWAVGLGGGLVVVAAAGALAWRASRR